MFLYAITDSPYRANECKPETVSEVFPLPTVVKNKKIDIPKTVRIMEIKATNLWLDSFLDNHIAKQTVRQEPII
jgi:hypothetical protein